MGASSEKIPTGQERIGVEGILRTSSRIIRGEESTTDRCSREALRSPDVQSRMENIFKIPDTTPREKGSDGPPERPTSSDDPSTQVWEDTPTRERKKLSSERELTDEELEQDWE